MKDTVEPKTIIVGPGITVLDEPGEHSVKWFATPASADSIDIRQVSATSAHLVVLKGNEHWIGNYKGSVIAWSRIVTKSAAPASWAWLAKPWAWIKSAASYAKPVLPYVLTAALAVGAFAVTQQQGCSIPWPNPVNPVDPPKPPPNPSPFPDKGLRVLFVIEGSVSSGKSAKLTPKQHAELNGESLAVFLNARCVKDGNQPGWRVFDEQTPLATAPEVWRQAMGRTRTSVPWMVIGNGTSGWEGPLPDGGILAKVKEFAP